MSPSEKALSELISLRIAAEAALPRNRETSLVITKLEEAEMWLQRAIRTEAVKQLGIGKEKQ